MKHSDGDRNGTLNPRKNFESFDLWGKAQFAMWSNIRFDFELIAELTRYRHSAKTCLELLDSVNHHLKGHSDKVFFDGTIKCLKYLVKNKYLVISDLSTLTHDDKYLIELLNKYSNKLDITEILSDIEEPTLRGMLLEYPHLLGEVLKDKLGVHLISKAMVKNGITDINSFTDKVDNGLNSIEVDKDKYSKEAMKCKIIYLGLRLNNGKLKIHSDAKEIINLFETLTDKTIEDETYTKGIINSMYVAMYGSDEWNQERKTHLSGCETLYLDFQLLSMPDNHMSLIYELFLKEETDKIGKKYFGDDYEYEGCVVSLAIKMVITIVLFRTENFIPQGEKAETDLFTAGALLGALNYAVEETDDGQQPLRLKKWFLDYYKNEVDKRVAFIKLQIDNGVGIYQMRDMVRAVYIPVFESFRFFCSKYGLVEQTIDLLKNKKISSEVKDDIYINFVINIQKIITEREASEEEKYFKDAFILLISEAFEGLSKKITREIKTFSATKKYYEETDLEGDASMAIIELILHFDLSKNDSFIGYLSSNLRYKIISSSRMNEIDKKTATEIEYRKNDLENDFMENVPDASDFIKTLDEQQNLERIREYIEKLPEKERAAIKKIADSNEKLNDTERKAKNRGLNKIREMMGSS